MITIGDITSLARRVINALGLDLDTGFLRVEYDDVFPGGSWEVPSGASAPDIVTVTIGGVPIRMKAFDGGSTEELTSNSFEIIHGIACDEVTAGDLKLEIHLHGTPSTTGTGTARFWMDWMIWPVDGSAAQAQTPLSIDFVIASDKQYRHLVKGVELPTITVNIGDIIRFNLRRTPADAADTYGADFLIDQCAIHAPFDGRGSRQRYVK